jgi:hypothetical protein
MGLGELHNVSLHVFVQYSLLLLLGFEPSIVQSVASHSNSEKVFVTLNVFGKCRVSNVDQDWID